MFKGIVVTMQNVGEIVIGDIGFIGEGVELNVSGNSVS